MRYNGNAAARASQQVWQPQLFRADDVKRDSSGSTNYTRRLLRDNRWQAAVDYSSPMTAWTQEMHKVLAECGGDKLKAATVLARRYR